MSQVLQRNRHHRYVCCANAEKAPVGRVAAIAWLCGAAQAQPPDGAVKKLPPVTVTATTTRGAVQKSYRKMIAGMDLFERMHSLAPAASLRYKLLPRQPGTDMDRIELEVLGDTVAIPVRVAADHTFTLERDGKAAAENAAVTPNRHAQSMTWRVEIRTPGFRQTRGGSATCVSNAWSGTKRA